MTGDNITQAQTYLELCRRITRANAVTMANLTGKGDMTDPRNDFLRQLESSRMILRAELTATVKILLEDLGIPQERYLEAVNQELQEALKGLEEQLGIQYDPEGNIVLGKQS